MHFRRSRRPQTEGRASRFSLEPLALISTSLVVVGCGGGESRKKDKRGTLQADPCLEGKELLQSREEPGQGWPRGRATSAVTQGPAPRRGPPPPALPVSAVAVLPFWFIFGFVSGKWSRTGQWSTGRDPRASRRPPASPGDRASSQPPFSRAGWARAPGGRGARAHPDSWKMKGGH